RDPRRQLSKPELLALDTDPLRLTQGRVVDGIVTSVTGFAAFVDLGLAQEAIIHVSDLSDRYVRDARELISIGQVVRAKIKDASGKKLALTMKGVPAPGAKPKGGSRSGGGSRSAGQDSRGKGRGGRDKPSGPPRRGELLGGGRSRRPGGPGGAGGRGDRKGRPERLTREDRADLDRLNKSSSEGASYNPFASFFGSDTGEQGEVQADPSAKKKASKKKATKKKTTKKKATKKAEEKADPQPASEPGSEKDS
ncbi:MAG: S1 RNA-binding domain-containing protein, partial [Planctomycetota bacterium]|nr:S1 RNA-binding domain-containing protein [Planctomycetota bacterium]